MSKALSASKNIMKNYLSELLTDDVSEQASETNSVVENERLETLLKNVNAELDIAPEGLNTDKSNGDITARKIDEFTPLNEETELVTHKSTNDFGTNIAKIKTDKNYRQGNFQALFFNVGGLTLAVPLIELGGIHKVEKTTTLMGKPDWFKGVMLYRDEKINVVDTALWVMPEKCDDAMKSALNYQYIIMLSDSPWGLMAENLVDTVTLSQEQVKWLDSPSKRPWLAGLVKDRMCALLDVDSLIQLLNEGSGIYQVDS